MTLNFGVLPTALIKPKEAYDGIIGSVTMMDGILMAVILSILGTLITLVNLPIIDIGSTVVGIVIGIVIGVVLLSVAV